MSDRLTGALFAAIAVWYGYTAQFYTMDFADPLGPSAFPQVLAVPFGLLAVYLMLRPDPDPEWVLGGRLVKQAGIIALLIVYSQVLGIFGFVLSTAVLAALLSLSLGARPIPAILSGAASGVGFFFMFDRLFELPLPTGTLFGS